MSDLDAYQDDMGRIANLTDRELDGLLAGKVVSGGDDLEELAAFLQDARVLCERSHDGAAEAQTIAAIVKAAQLVAAETPPAEAQASVDERVRSGHRASWRKPMRVKLVTTAAGLVLLAAFSGAAYAGALGPVQGTVADLAGNVGVTLPGGENDADEGNVNDLDNGELSNVDEGNVGDVDDGAQGDVDDGPANDRDDGAQGDDDGPANDRDDGAQNNVDDGNVGDVDDGSQGDVDDGQQGDSQSDERGSGSGQSGAGQGGGSGQGGGGQSRGG